MPTKIEKDSLTGIETTGHEWDGIKELNTPLPKWWLWIFYATIAFSVVWMVVYPSFPGWRGLSGWVAREAVMAEMATVRAQQEPILARLREASPAEIAADPTLRAFALAGGRIAFANNCAGCHGTGGQGAPGGFPSLVDDEWIWGGSLEAIKHTILHGVRANESEQQRQSQMPRYGLDGLLTAQQIRDVTEFVLSLSQRRHNREAAARGETIYAEQCASCHGDRGEGNRELGAPRLNDHIWLYGGRAEEIAAQIRNPRHGVMPSWQGRLDPAIINMLTIFVHALGGGE